MTLEMDDFLILDDDSFRNNHLRKEAPEYHPLKSDQVAESWRAALESEFTVYTSSHYKHGICSVLGKSDGDEITLTACIEDQQFQPKNYWNGNWRSQWVITFTSGTAELRGLLKVQVHYYEDGNVQLDSSKDVKEVLNISTEQKTAKAFLRIVEDSENEYQTAILENYQTMSDTIFKGLRRQLPVTRTKIDWNKLVSYSIAKELKSQ